MERASSCCGSSEARRPPRFPPSDVDEALIGPGIWGFVIFAFVAIASILLIIDMVRRTRRVRYRAEIQERLAAEAERTEATDGD